jgi:hypothetical protein
MAPWRTGAKDGKDADNGSIRSSSREEWKKQERYESNKREETR